MTRGDKSINYSLQYCNFHQHFLYCTFRHSAREPLGLKLHLTLINPHLPAEKEKFTDDFMKIFF